jgi:hypothetical protein
MAAGAAWRNVVVFAPSIEPSERADEMAYRIIGRNGYTVRAEIDQDGITTLS